MKKALVILFAAMLAGIGVAARTARDFFVSAPDDVLRLLPQATRLDMLDYFEFGSTHPSINAFGGEAHMTALSDATVAFDTDKDVHMQLAIVPTAKNDTLLALVTTLHMPAADSHISFFDTAWRPVAKAPFAMPGYDEWLSPEGLTGRDDVLTELPFMPVSAAFDAEGLVLLLTNEAPAYLDKSRTDSIAAKFIPSKVYDIKDGKFLPRQ